MIRWDGRPVVFFDGLCGLCHWSVRFVLRHDKAGQFVYAPLAGTTAKEALQELLAAHPDLDSIVLLEDAGSDHPRISTHAQAALRICWLLGGWWKVPGVLGFLPGWLFNWAYRCVAANRYRIWGKVKSDDILYDPKVQPHILP